MIARLFEIFIIICALGGGVFLLQRLINDIKVSRALAKQQQENRRVIAISKTSEALRKNTALDLQIVLRLYGDEMGEELAQRVRNALIDLAYTEATKS